VRHLHLHIRFLDAKAWPDEIKQLVLGNDTITVLDQGQQDIESTRADRQRLPVAENLSLYATNFKAAEAIAAWHDVLPVA
jgi:hypothetical protein